MYSAKRLLEPSQHISREDQMKVFKGTLVHCLSADSVETLKDYVIGVDEQSNGKVQL